MKRKTWDNLGCLARDFTFCVENSKTMLCKLHGLAKFVSKRMKQGLSDGSTPSPGTKLTN